MRRHWGLLGGIVAGVVLLLGVGGYLWLTDLADPMPETADALVSDERVTVATEPWLTFIPAGSTTTGLILYPGGRVPPQAYAPAARSIAEAGFLSVIPSVPFGLAVLAPDVADDVIAAHPEVDRWVVGGHSLGGAMAAQYADGHDVDGLLLWAAYPPDGNDLSGDDLAVGSIYASEDGLTTLDEIEASRARLPPAAELTEVSGGNHAGFGWYGAQAGDGVASVSREDQQAQVVAASVGLLEQVAAQG